jgi:KipI family sensor histidine kinase inhibitor
VTGRLLPSGEQAVLVEVDSLAEVLALHELLWLSGRTPGLLDAVTGARTLLLVAESASALTDIRTRATDALRELDHARHADQAGPGVAGERQQLADRAEVVEIAVHYDGPDLADVAALTGLSPDEVVRAHTARPWLVGFSGFAPGFAYLVDGDPRLQVARRSTPRPRVPAGAVGLAGEFSGVYPRSSPGGWQLIGHTDQHLWDLDREPPALLRPGLRVRFMDAQAGR